MAGSRSWRYVVCDLTGTSVGEPRAFDRQLTVGVSRASSASFRIRADDPLWSTIAAGDTMLKIYDTAQALRFYGPIITDEETAQGQGATVAVTAADLSWVLARRYVGKNLNGVETTYGPADSGAIAYSMLSEVNADQATGITAGASDTFVSRTYKVLWKRMIDGLSELGGVAGSYEWTLRYVDGSPPTVLLDLYSSLGSDKTTVVFLEYGTGKANCGQYSRSRSVEQRATRVWALGGGTTLVAAAFDTAAETKGRAEDVLSFGDISSAAMLDALAAAHVAIRKNARQLVSLTPFPKTAPKYGVDWVVGDLVSARVVVRKTVRVSGFARVWGATIQIDGLGVERATLQLEPQ